MMKDLLIVLVITIGLASANDQCAWGESYWCSSLQNAKECGAFQHCLTTLWKNQKLEEDASEVCSYCESVVTDVKSFLTQKQTQDQIKQFMESACSFIPVSDMADECKQMVDTYLPEMLIMIEAELDPQMICSMLGLCKGIKDTVQHRPIHSLHRVPLIKVPQAQAEPICGDCKKFMTDIKNQVTSPATEKQIEQLLEQNLCANLGALQDECKTLVESYVPELMELLSSQFDPAQICQVMGFCAQTENSPRALLAKMRLSKSPLYKSAQLMAGSAECDLCKTLVTEIQAMEKDQKTQKEIEDFIKNNICSVLGAMRGACEETVDQYGPIIFALLEEETDPTKVCQAIGLCANPGSLSNTIQPVVIKPKMLTVPVEPIKPRPVHASAQCILCEFLMTKLDSMLQQNATQAEIKAALQKVCSLLPKTVSQECENFVDTYAPAILTILSQELSPAVVCTTLGLCGSNDAVTSMAESPEICGVCETLMQYVDTLLTQNSTEQEMEHLMEKVCNFLPSSYATECNDIVKQYGVAIIRMLAQFADPREVCADLGLCGSKKIQQVPMEKIVPAKVQLLGTNECTYGPAYWCASKENAEKCKAVSHCKKHVWQN